MSFKNCLICVLHEYKKEPLQLNCTKQVFIARSRTVAVHPKVCCFHCLFCLAEVPDVPRWLVLPQFLPSRTYWFNSLPEKLEQHWCKSTSRQGEKEIWTFQSSGWLAAKQHHSPSSNWRKNIIRRIHGCWPEVLPSLRLAYIRNYRDPQDSQSASWVYSAKYPASSVSAFPVLFMLL